MKKSYRKLSVVSEILTILLLVHSILLFSKQSGSVIFYIWYIGPLSLLILSHGAYFTKKWLYTVPMVGLAFLILLAVNHFDLVLGVILFLAVLFYWLVCFVHQNAVHRGSSDSGEYMESNPGL